MNWFKDNPFLAGILAVAIVGAAVFGYLIAQSATALSASSEAYTEAVNKLHALQNKVPFPSAENLKAIQENLAEHTDQIDGFRKQLAKMELPLDESITPQQFQDGLRSAVNEIRTKAEENHVELPANFYFGFDEYQTQVPSEQAAPFLYRQFLVIQSFITRLVDFKVTAIDGVTRAPLPQESGSAAGRPNKSDASEPVLQRFPFDVSFKAEQGKFRVAFNSLLGSEQFLIVRSVTVENSSPQAPAKRGLEAVSPSTSNAFTAGDSTNSAGGLQVILGREILKVTMQLEMLDFAEPVVAKP
jgi:DNA-binding protein H-NS